ncbi:hypothetical protein [Gordonia sp. PP30]|uniref:hypothetical protein n=1 Tax=unclassified Gordonia (in: high G+C Gram-positive bacteria) TaxID=2657482 RepID=UPI0020000973|nr:hypothetical protein [Gordonia sp. PP30]UQE76547.1 hypothetical protein MYK68_08295 [Gordonia sp. PP30]
MGMVLAVVLPVVAMVLAAAPARALPGASEAGGQPHTILDTADLQRGGTPDPGLRNAMPAAPLDQTDDEVVPGAPMPVPAGAFGYLATRSATLWLAAQDPAGRIKALPVPPSYRPANDALAAQMDRELTAAVKTKGACVQIIIDPNVGGGNLFQYGVWSVDRQYCP